MLIELSSFSSLTESDDEHVIVSLSSQNILEEGAYNKLTSK